ncbi:hypothetical protein E2C01_011767 [Portunus trituberculatus]|uniref:Uncharacterized protein n=1 Tax=Portunus trituberculatus TaxID=210409 RepID=A0A5B7DC49_PORTR|nr:hypothetical protein [Portunus trituberculatus]
MTGRAGLVMAAARTHQLTVETSPPTAPLTIVKCCRGGPRLADQTGGAARRVFPTTRTDRYSCTKRLGAATVAVSYTHHQLHFPEKTRLLGRCHSSSSSSYSCTLVLDGKVFLVETQDAGRKATDGAGVGRRKASRRVNFIVSVGITLISLLPRETRRGQQRVLPHSSTWLITPPPSECIAPYGFPAVIAFLDTSRASREGSATV